MFGVLIAASVGLGGAGAALHQVRLVTRSAPPKDEQAALLLSKNGAIVAQALHDIFPDADQTSVETIVSPGSPAAGAVAVNELLGDRARSLSEGDGVARAAFRASLFSGTLGAVLELADHVAHPSAGWSAAGASFIIGCLAAVACFELGRLRARRVADAKTRWDRVGASLGKRLEPNVAKDPLNPGSETS